MRDGRTREWGYGVEPGVQWVRIAKTPGLLSVCRLVVSGLQVQEAIGALSDDYPRRFIGLRRNGPMQTQSLEAGRVDELGWCFALGRVIYTASIALSVQSNLLYYYLREPYTEKHTQPRQTTEATGGTLIKRRPKLVHGLRSGLTRSSERVLIDSTANGIFLSINVVFFFSFLMRGFLIVVLQSAFVCYSRGMSLALPYYSLFNAVTQ